MNIALKKQHSALIKELVIATHNTGKIQEIEILLKELIKSSLFLPKVHISKISDYSNTEPDEVGKTFIENAELKARHACAFTKKASLADDSGLVIPILNGDPGVYSARWAIKRPDGKRDFTNAFLKIQERLKDVSAPLNPRAHFVCALSIALPDGRIFSSEGFCHGSLTFPAKGNSLFGYNPIFVKDGADKTFGEMERSETTQVSHRYEAFQNLSKLLSSAFS